MTIYSSIGQFETVPPVRMVWCHCFCVGLTDSLARRHWRSRTREPKVLWSLLHRRGWGKSDSLNETSVIEIDEYSNKRPLEVVRRNEDRYSGDKWILLINFSKRIHGRLHQQKLSCVVCLWNWFVCTCSWTTYRCAFCRTSRPSSSPSTPCRTSSSFTFPSPPCTSMRYEQSYFLPC